MPVLDGYGVLARVSQDARISDIPFLFLTARIGRDDMRLGMNLGADDYITKPFPRKEILQAVRTRLEKRQRLEALTEKKQEDFRSQVYAHLPRELVAPLSVILGFSELLQEQSGKMDAREIQSLSRNIHHSAENLLRLVENYLFYAELESWARDPAKKELYQQVDSVDGVAAVQGIVNHQLGQAGREKDVEWHLQEAKIKIYEPHLDKIVEELVMNSLLRSAPGTPIRIDGARVSGRPYYCLRLADAGKPLDQDAVQLIQSAGRLNTDVYRQQEMNIGLVLVKRLVDVYHGAFRIYDRPEKGVVFEVFLPVEA
jgi:signal transduction histidine kinase